MAAKLVIFKIMETKQTPTHSWLTPKQVAEMFPGGCGGNLSPATISRWIRTGCNGHVLKSRKIGGRVYVRQSDLEAFIEDINTYSQGGGDPEASEAMSTEIADAIAKANLAAHHGIFVP
jgi:hypothetical protein